MRTLVKSLLCALTGLLVVAASAGAHVGARIHIRHRSRHRATRPYLAGMSPLARFKRLQAIAPTTTGGDFDVPWGLAADGAGNVYVVNSAGNYVDKISAAYGIRRLSLIRLNAPASIAIDPERQYMYVGNANTGNGTGNITEYGVADAFSVDGGYQQTITTNAGTPMSIATDGFDDLWVLDSPDVAVDSYSGESLSGNVAQETGGQSVQSVAEAGSLAYAFYNSGVNLDNGEAALAGGSLGFVYNTSAQQPTSATCSTAGTCWLFDAATDTLQLWSMGNTIKTARLSYYPAGLAYDPVHKHLFASNPDANTVVVYNATTLAPIKTLS